MRLAIVVPFFNVEKYIAEAVNSLKNQSYSDFVAYFVNDGSTDKSSEIVSRLIHDDPRFILVEQENQGVSHARNTALQKIYERDDIDFIGFLDGDDTFSKDLFKEFVEHVDDTFDYCVFGMQSSYRSGGVPGGEVLIEHNQVVDHDEILKHFWGIKELIAPKQLNQTHSQCLCNRFYAFQVIKGHFFDESMQLGEDQDLFIVLSPQLQKGLVLPYIGLNYRQRLSSACYSAKDGFSHAIPSLFYCFKKHLMKEMDKKEPNAIFVNGIVRHLLSQLLSTGDHIDLSLIHI